MSYIGYSLDRVDLGYSPDRKIDLIFEKLTFLCLKKGKQILILIQKPVKKIEKGLVIVIIVIELLTCGQNIPQNQSFSPDCSYRLEKIISKTRHCELKDATPKRDPSQKQILSKSDQETLSSSKNSEDPESYVNRDSTSHSAIYDDDDPTSYSINYSKTDFDSNPTSDSTSKADKQETRYSKAEQYFRNMEEEEKKGLEEIKEVISEKLRTSNGKSYVREASRKTLKLSKEGYKVLNEFILEHEETLKGMASFYTHDPVTTTDKSSPTHNPIANVTLQKGKII